MKKVYQYFGEYVDVRNGVQYTCCFLTSQEAQAWKEKVNAMGANHGSLSSRNGVSPTGEWQQDFCVEAYMQSMNEWLGDHRISGRD